MFNTSHSHKIARRSITPASLALGRQKQVGFCEFEASLVYKVSSRIDRIVTQRNPVSKN